MKSNNHESVGANKLHEYMKQRANYEKVGYGLEYSFYYQCLTAGVREFFGVTVDPTGEHLVSDQQNPKFFNSYQREVA